MEYFELGDLQRNLGQPLPEIVAKQPGCLRPIWAHEISFFVRNPELGWAGVSCG